MTVTDAQTGRLLRIALGAALTIGLGSCLQDQGDSDTVPLTVGEADPASAPLSGEAAVPLDENATQTATKLTQMARDVSPPSSEHTTNRLIHEKSPYLLQHAYNPVDWYPWGEDAFAKAREEQKPIFLSIGYSTCHWCHVMERESFENPQIAELMNQWFVSIKVDREELPDVDHLYMNAVMMLTGRGGWPLTVFLTPDLKPFFGGTYFPPEQRWQTPGMNQLLPNIAQAWKDKRDEVSQSADHITAELARQLVQQAPPGTPTVESLRGAYDLSAAGFDQANGGFGEAPKFPRSHQLSFLLTYWSRTRSPKALEMVTTTLDHLAAGGIYDHLGGGFHRYSTDAQWLVPHFEKMLYDQAMLARTYLEAYRITRRAEYAEVARGILDYVLRDLTDPRGGFQTAEDADSEGEEGKFYVWTPQEIESVLGAEEAAAFNAYYGVTPEGNFEHGTSILNIDPSKPQGGDSERLAQARAKLLAARARRVRPLRDDKILTSWNGLMIAGFAYGASTLQEPRYLEAAERAADFVLANLQRDTTLLRRYRDGEAIHAGTLEDYAFFGYGLLELYEAGFKPAYLAEAKRIAEEMVERFWDEADGGLFMRDAGEGEPLIARSKESYDGALPSGNSVAALVLLRIGRLTADQRLEGYGRRVLETFGRALERTPVNHTQMLLALDFALGPSQEVVIAGDPSSADTAGMIGELHARFLPRTVIVLHPVGDGRAAIESLVPYVKTQETIRGQATAYVCENYICNLPTTDRAKFVALLERQQKTENRGLKTGD